MNVSQRADRPVALITGAARGIGAATAQEFARRGYRLALVDRSQECLAEIGQQLGSGDSDLLMIGFDLAEPQSVEAMVDRVADQFGRLDVLINNAAWRERVTMRAITLDSWEKTLRICLTAPAFLARAAARHMERAGRGVIVNVTSIMARQAAGIAPAYVACKGALESLTYDLAALYGPSGIRVVAVAPGAIDTELSRDVRSQGSVGDESVRQSSESMIMLGRWGSVEEIAQAIAWIASDQASYLTGTTVDVDGGWLRHHTPHDPGKFDQRH